jgi:hypothetical protein
MSNSTNTGDNVRMLSIKMPSFNDLFLRLQNAGFESFATVTKIHDKLCGRHFLREGYLVGEIFDTVRSEIKEYMCQSNPCFRDMHNLRITYRNYTPAELCTDIVRVLLQDHPLIFHKLMDDQDTHNALHHCLPKMFPRDPEDVRAYEEYQYSRMSISLHCKNSMDMCLRCELQNRIVKRAGENLLPV